MLENGQKTRQEGLGKREKTQTIWITNNKQNKRTIIRIDIGGE